MTSRATRPRVTPPLTKQLAPPVSCLLNPPTQPGGSRKEIEVVLGLRRYDCDRKRFQSKPGRGPAISTSTCSRRPTVSRHFISLSMESTAYCMESEATYNSCQQCSHPMVSYPAFAWASNFEMSHRRRVFCPYRNQRLQPQERAGDLVFLPPWPAVPLLLSS